MGSNRGRKAGGGSQDFGAGLKYNSRLEVCVAVVSWVVSVTETG
uniref:Suppression of tumorigenicity 14 (colon carcinoma) n=1 Tax=Mus musculus TaxID=10090 RepID=D6RIN3_MOUSE